MSTIDRKSSGAQGYEVTPKGILVTFLGSVMLANPVVFFLIFNNVLLVIALPLVAFIFLLSMDKLAGNRRSWVFAYSVNFAVLLSVGFHGEAVFRIIGEHYMIKDLYDVRNGYPFNKPSLNKTLTDREYISQYVTNSQGFRLPVSADPGKEIHDCDWLFLGDSFTQGAQVNYENLYTSVLQKYFPDKVIVNLGVSGIGIPEQYEMAKDFIPLLKPEIVFLQVSTFNDFMRVKPREMDFLEALLHHSELARFLLFEAVFVRRESLPLGRWAEPFYPTHEENRLYNVFYLPTSQEKDKDLENYKQYLGRLSALCLKNGVKLALILVPSKEQGDIRFLNDVIEEFRIDSGKLDMDRPNQLLAEWANTYNADYFDMTTSFRNSQIPLFFDVDEHPNVDGHALIAEEIAFKMARGSSILSGPETLSGLFEGARYPSLSSDGKLMVYQSILNGKTVAILRETGEPEQEVVSFGGSIVHPNLSADGSWLAFTQGDVSTRSTKVVLLEKASGRKINVTAGINEYGAIPQFSRDGKKLAFAGWSYNAEHSDFTMPQIVVVDLETWGIKTIGNGSAEYWRPCFSPDGRSIAYISNADGDFDIYLTNLHSGETRQITDTPFDEWDPNFNPDSTRLIFAAKENDNWDLFEMDLSSGKNVRVTNTKGDEWDPVYSVDQDMIYYAGEFGFSGGVYSRNAVK